MALPRCPDAGCESPALIIEKREKNRQVAPGEESFSASRTKSHEKEIGNHRHLIAGVQSCEMVLVRLSSGSLHALRWAVPRMRAGLCGTLHRAEERRGRRGARRLQQGAVERATYGSVGPPNKREKRTLAVRVYAPGSVLQLRAGACGARARGRAKAGRVRRERVRGRSPAAPAGREVNRKADAEPSSGGQQSVGDRASPGS
ncbi:hypothetical protein B0H17DRAFT_1271409 [Mycena rosella]|uniref:Uncharacterized protein n=1 Tax=Mycena rosella TaxID=1033263 RepID=A0AAD7G096_MYCRO|nr:hypothetical protein B0H17DRAFT_1271409 [Mycena rosella]